MDTHFNYVSSLIMSLPNILSLLCSLYFIDSSFSDKRNHKIITAEIQQTV